MFEYVMRGEKDNDLINNIQNPSSFIYTRLKDGHTLLLSPVSYECELTVDQETGKEYYKKLKEPYTINTINHTVVPKDAQDSMFYMFLDPDYKYIDESIMNQIYYNQLKIKQYDKYMSNAFDSNGAPLEDYFASIPDVRWDHARLYFVNGYDFSNVYGIYIRITVDGDDTQFEKNRQIDLCDLFINKSTFYKLCKFSVNPTMFGNNIYDRYIEISVPCLYDLIKGKYKDYDGLNFFSVLKIKDDTNVRLSFAYILEEDAETSKLDYKDYKDYEEEFPSIVNDEVNLDFTRSSVMNGVIPTGDMNSDYLGAYIAEFSDAPYLIFYATWRDKPLTSSIVWQFNKGIRLYDRSLIRDDYDIEVDDDTVVDYDIRKWMVVHDIKCSFCMGDHVVKEETYSMTQIFVSDKDPDKFYYRPIIFDQPVGMYIDNVQIVYTVRLINAHDKIQFVKIATLSLYGNLSKFYAKGTTLGTSELTPYKIYNKIIEQKHESVYGNNGPQKTKYIKVFYDSTDVVVDDNGTPTAGSYNYTLTVSQAPKTYKFVFKNMAPNGTYGYMDLSNGYYKLLFKDAENNDNVIDPTYSENMNVYVGELEYNFSAAMVNKMLAVDEGNRKMSIVTYNEDGSVSSMFDFMYTF